LAHICGRSIRKNSSRENGEIPNNSGEELEFLVKRGPRGLDPGERVGVITPQEKGGSPHPTQGDQKKRGVAKKTSLFGVIGPPKY